MESPAADKDDKNQAPPPFQRRGLFEYRRDITNFLIRSSDITLSLGLILEAVGSIFRIPFNTAASGGLAGLKKFGAQNYSSLLFDAYVMGITWFQYQNIRQVYSVAIGFELDKKPQEVGFLDLLRSKNSVVRGTRQEFKNKILGRTGALFTPFIPYISRASATLHPGITSGSLAIESEIEKRFHTVWDGLLALTEKNKPTDHVTADEVEQILAMHKAAIYKGNPSTSPPPAHGSDAEKHDRTLAYYIAQLLDDYHQRGQNTSSGHFRESTLIYLMGNEPEQGKGKSFLDQKFPINMAYVELARKDQDGLPAVKEVAKAIAAGKDPDEAFKEHDVNMHQLAKDEENMRIAADNAVAMRSQKLGNTTATALLRPQLSHVERLNASNSANQQNRTLTE